MKTFKWGIGARQHCQQLRQRAVCHTDAVPWAVGSRDWAGAFCRKYGFQRLTAYDELSTTRMWMPPAWRRRTFHEEAVLTCLRQGKPVLCESPCRKMLPGGWMIAEA